MNFILKLEKCRKKWCKVSSDKIKGWAKKKAYGVLNSLIHIKSFLVHF